MVNRGLISKLGEHLIHKCSGHVLQYVDDEYLWKTIFLSNADYDDVVEFDIIKQWNDSVGLIEFNNQQCQVMETDDNPSILVGSPQYKFLFDLD